MGEFVDHVRNGAIAHPAQKSFDLEKWKSDYAKCVNPDSQDASLYNAGIFFDGVLGALRHELSLNAIEKFSKSELIICVAALMNHDVRLLDEKTSEKLEESKGAGVVPSQSISPMMIKLPSGITATPDQIITNALDSATFPLSVAEGLEEKGDTIDEKAMGRVFMALRIGSAYRIASDLLMGCIWEGNLLAQANDLTEIKPLDEVVARLAAASESRYSSLITELTHRAVQGWRHTLSLATKKEFSLDSAVVGYDEKRSNPFIVGKVAEHRKRNLPSGALDAILMREIYLKPFLALSFPKHSELNINLIFDAWRVLASAAKALIQSVPNNTESFEDYKRYAALVKKQHLIGVLVRALSISESIAKQILEFLTFAGEINSLWTQPLIAVGSESFALAVGALLHGNMLRAAERWLRQGGYDLARRGPKFEALARTRLTQILTSSAVMSDWVVAPGSVRIADGKEEIDLLFRVGNLVFVGEAKCQLFPADPIERARFEGRIQEGVAQAKRKADAARANINEVASLLNAVDTQPLNVVPFLLSNMALGAGYPRDGVAVVDLVFLSTLFGQGGLRQRVVLDKDGIVESGEFKKFYNSPEQADEVIPNLMQVQPAIQALLPLVKRRQRPMPITYKPAKISEVYFSVSLEKDGWDFEASS